MPDIKPGRKSLPLVSDLVSAGRGVKERAPLGAAARPPPALPAGDGDRGGKVSQAVLRVPPCPSRWGAVRMAQMGSPHPKVLLFNAAPVSRPYPKHQPEASRRCGSFPISLPTLCVPPSPSHVPQPGCWAQGPPRPPAPYQRRGRAGFSELQPPPHAGVPSSPWAARHRVALLSPPPPPTGDNTQCWETRPPLHPELGALRPLPPLFTPPPPPLCAFPRVSPSCPQPACPLPSRCPHPSAPPARSGRR